MGDAWAEVERLDDSSFEITIHPIMCIRDTTATVIHEMLHVKQWIHESKRDEEDDERRAGNPARQASPQAWQGDGRFGTREAPRTATQGRPSGISFWLLKFLARNFQQ